MHVEFTTALPEAASRCPATAGRTVYRIVQEGLTNAAKHAPGCTVLVRLSGAPDEGIDVLVRNPIGFARTGTPAPGSAWSGSPSAPSCAAAGSSTGRRIDVRPARMDTVGGVTAPVIRVLVVDDDPLVRSALRLMLGGQPDIEVVGEAADGRAGVAAARGRSDPTWC